MKTPLMRIGDLSEQVRGVSYGKQDASSEPLPGYLPVLRAGNITDDGLVFEDLVYVPAERISSKQKVRHHDVVIAASSGSIDVVGKAAPALADFDGGFGAFCKVLRPKSNVHPVYFAHFFKTKDYRRRVSALAAGVNINNLRNEHLDDMEIPIPPLAEQERIAEMLNRAEELRAKRRAALTYLDTLSQALFLDLFGNPATNTKEWTRKSLKVLGKVTTGGTPPSAKDGMFNGPIPFITPGDLERDEPVKRSLTNAGAEESATIRAGAVLVCCIGATIGKMAKARERSAFNQQINAVEWTGEVDDCYGLAVLRFFKPTIVAWGASTTLPILKKSAFEKISVPVPPLPLQREFARRITAVEKLKTTHLASLTEMDALFASLQHRAFRGEL
ncbi:MAG: restriction endonuclease subunit S [Candidatus Latescibacterota bacterium]